MANQNATTSQQQQDQPAQGSQQQNWAHRDMVSAAV